MLLFMHDFLTFNQRFKWHLFIVDAAFHPMIYLTLKETRTNYLIWLKFVIFNFHFDQLWEIPVETWQIRNIYVSQKFILLKLYLQYILFPQDERLIFFNKWQILLDFIWIKNVTHGNSFTKIKKNFVIPSRNGYKI